jgi:hypothetical protein
VKKRDGQGKPANYFQEMVEEGEVESVFFARLLVGRKLK